MELTRSKSSGVAKGGLTTGIIGTALGGLNTLALMGGGAALAGGWGRNNTTVDVIPTVPMPMAGAFSYGYPYPFNNENCGCSEDHHVTRYDAQKDAEIAALKAHQALLEANIYNDQKVTEVYRYIDGKLNDIEKQLAQQATINQANADRFVLTEQITADKFALAEQKRECCCDKVNMRIDQEIEARKCADNQIVNYVNATFYPHQIADITTGTTTTTQKTWNPLPQCCNRE